MWVAVGRLSRGLLLGQCLASTMALGKTLNQQRTRWSETQKFALWKSCELSFGGNIIWSKLVPSFLVASLQCWSSSLAHNLRPCECSELPRYALCSPK
jgi:hypothetical protein